MNGRRSVDMSMILVLSLVCLLFVDGLRVKVILFFGFLIVLVILVDNLKLNFCFLSER